MTHKSFSSVKVENISSGKNLMALVDRFLKKNKVFSNAEFIGVKNNKMKEDLLTIYSIANWDEPFKNVGINSLRAVDILKLVL